MGLGKTFQVTSVLAGMMAAAQAQGGPGTVSGTKEAAGSHRGQGFATALVIVPLSLIPTWQAELEVCTGVVVWVLPAPRHSVARRGVGCCVGGRPCLPWPRLASTLLPQRRFLFLPRSPFPPTPQKWLPDVPVFVLHGAASKKRSAEFQRLHKEGGVCVTTYGSLTSPKSLLWTARRPWDVLVLDEANKVGRCALTRVQRLSGLTGTGAGSSLDGGFETVMGANHLT